MIGALPDKMRVRMIWITFSILLLLASIEAGLAYMREVLLQDELATSALLRGGEAAIENNFLWITTAAQMGMGFILPFALVFVAIPLETFIHSLRTVVGLAGIGLLRSLALVLRVLGNGFRHLGMLTEKLYDLPLFVPLWLESRRAANGKQRGARVGPARGGAMKALSILACILLVACTQSTPVARNSGVYLLLDTSGTYRGELRKAEDVILYTLSRLEPADSFAVARIDTGSFSEKDIIAKTTFDERPSMANAQKRAFALKVKDFIARENAAQYTDITGGLLQAVEFLNEKGTGRKTILIFSDMEQDLDKGYMRDMEVPFEGFDVVALNVVKLRQDNYDPRQYMARLEQWKGQVEKAGGHWRVVNDLDRLDGML